MTVARSVADVLDDHVVFEVESIDRMYLNVWQPRLAYGGGVQGFFVGHRGYHYASTALMDPMTKAFVADIHGFVAARGLELVSLRQGPAQGRPRPAVPGQVHRRRRGCCSSAGPRRRPGCGAPSAATTRSTGGSYAWLVRSTAFINFFYFYCVDADFGPFFLKFSTYFPYTAKLCINGNEWAKRQAAKAGIGFDAAGQRVRRRATTCPRCSDLRQPGPGAHRRAAAQVAARSCPTRSPPPTRPPATATSCRSCRRSSR